MSCIFIDTVKAVNYKQIYCDGEETVEGDGASLECYGNRIGFKYGDKYSRGHIVFTKNDHDMCERYYHILKYPQFYGKFYESQEVTESLRKFGVKECGSDEGEYTLTNLLKNIKKMQKKMREDL